MSTAAVPGTYPAPQLVPLDRSGSCGTVNPQIVISRRGDIHQGRALEILGHAVEYLVDSRMFLVDEPATKADAEATSILMRLSREVFNECTKVASDRHNFGEWISRKFRVLSN